jgi:hypothetical protein
LECLQTRCRQGLSHFPRSHLCHTAHSGTGAGDYTRSGRFGGLAQSRFSSFAGFRAQEPCTNKAGLLRRLRLAHAARELFKAFEGIGKLANEEHQRGGLGIGLGAALLQTWIARIFRMVLSGSYILSILFIPVSKTGRHMQCRSTCRLGFLLPLPSAREKLPSLLPRARAVW